MIALAVAIVFLVKNIIGLHLEQNDLKKQETSLEERRDELTEELKNVDDLEYIEEQARKLLRMIKPGEVLYILDDASTEADGEGSEANASEDENQDESSETDSSDEESSDNNGN